MQEPDVTGKRTRFEDSDEGEVSDSPPIKRSKSDVNIVNSDVVKGTEVDYGDFMLDRTESYAVDEDGNNLSQIAEWSGNISSLLTPNSSAKSTPVAPASKPRFKATCFNCEGDHNLYQCPEPRDARRIRERQAAFNEMRKNNERARYHADDSNCESKYQAGRISQDLRKALGIGPDEIPEWIYRMRRMGFIEGYPPGYLKQAIAKDEESGVLEFHLIDDEVKAEAEDDRPDSPPPVINSRKMIYYLGFNKTYRNLRDKENYDVPPFETFVDFHRNHLREKHEEEMKMRRKIREFEKSQREKRKKELEDDEDVVILPPPRPTFGLDDDDDVVIIDRKGMTSPEPSKQSTSDDVFKTPSLPRVPSTPGSSTGVVIGTPILTRRSKDGKVLSASCPDLDKFSVGIVPFTATEEPTPHKGFLRKIMNKIKSITK